MNWKAFLRLLHIMPKNTSESVAETAMSWEEQDALEARDIVEAIKEKMKTGRSGYELVTDCTICDELESIAPTIAEVIAKYLLKHKTMPTADYVAEKTGQPKYYCRFIILRSGDQISELVAKAHRGQSVKSILYEKTTRTESNTKWVYHDYPSGKAENYIWDEDYYHRSADGHYETTYETVEERCFRINVYPTPLNEIKRIIKRGKIGKITPQVLDEILEKHFPL